MRSSLSLLTGLLSVAVVACAPTRPDATAATPVAATSASTSTPKSSTFSMPLYTSRPGLFSSGQPAASDWPAIAAHGITLVVNLRPMDEMSGRDEAAEVRAAGLRYIEIPVADGAAITAENARKLNEAIGSTEGAPVLVHCASANRAGGLLALMASTEEGMSDEAALAFGRRAGMESTETRVRELLAPID